MTLWGEIVLAVLGAAGLGVLVWWLFGRLLRPIPDGTIRGLISGRGEGEGLEQAVRTFVWLRSLGLLNCPIIIADVDLTPAGWELALRLASRWPCVVLWPARDLPDYITRI